MIYFFEIATVLLECLLVYIFFNAWFGIKNLKRAEIIFVFAVYFLLQCLISLVAIYPALRVIISYLLVFGVATVLYETTKASAVYSALLYLSLVVVSEYLCLVLLSALNFDVELLMSQGNTRIIYLVLAKAVQLIVVLITATILRKNRVALTFRQVAPLVLCPVVSVYICVVYFELISDYEERFSLMLMIALTGLLYINGIIVFYTQSIKSTVVKEEEQKLAAQHYEMQLQYYHSVLKDREETRAMWHDLKKHITAIEAIAASADNQYAKNECEQIRQAFDEVGNIVDIDNATLNTILYHNITRAKSENISVSLDAHVPPELPISAVDLSVIIGNTFDNAIEECTILTDENPEINVSLVQKNSMLFYEITNTCTQVPHKKAGKIHGYGLRNVRRCVDKYDGSMENGVSDGQYRVSIRLCYPLTVSKTT